MATATEKGQTLVELCVVLMGILTFTAITFSNWQSFDQTHSKNFFSEAKR